MRRVEFVGPMGAGKSSIYAEVMRRAHPDSNIRSAGFFKKKVLLKEARDAGLIHYVGLKSLCLMRRLEATLITEKITGSAWSAVSRQSPVWEAVIQEALSHDPGLHSSCADQIIRTSWFVRDLTDAALLLDLGIRGAIAVHDESLLQRGVGFGLGEKDSKHFGERYFRKVPAPDLVVHVSIPDTDVLEERVWSRARDVSRFVGHLATAVDLSNTAARIMQERGVPVIYCDGRVDVQTNAMRVFRAVEAMN